MPYEEDERAPRYWSELAVRAYYDYGWSAQEDTLHPGLAIAPTKPQSCWESSHWLGNNKQNGIGKNGYPQGWVMNVHAYGIHNSLRGRVVLGGLLIQCPFNF